MRIVSLKLGPIHSNQSMWPHWWIALWTVWVVSFKSLVNNSLAMSTPVIHMNQSAEKDSSGREYLEKEQWQKMGTQTASSKATAYLDKLVRKVTGDLEGEDLTRVLWLSSTLFFIVGGYWLLRSLKDPIMSVINGVSHTVYVAENRN